MESFKKLLLANKAWSQERRERDPKFFEELSKLQKPEFLWISCSDSRVPAEEITGTHPGELFVHRNIANLVVPGDVNFHSVLQYAVENLKVKHVIVCGHYGCGGVNAALTSQSSGILDQWLCNLKETYELHRDELDKLSDKERFDRMVEINVLDQVKRISQTAVIQKAWADRQSPTIHAWVFGLHDGIIRTLATIGHR